VAHSSTLFFSHAILSHPIVYRRPSVGNAVMTISRRLARGRKEAQVHISLSVRLAAFLECPAEGGSGIHDTIAATQPSRASEPPRDDKHHHDQT
jgi:hypothetical protein